MKNKVLVSFRPKEPDGHIRAEGTVLDGVPVKIVDKGIKDNVTVELLEDRHAYKKGDRVTVGFAEIALV